IWRSQDRRHPTLPYAPGRGVRPSVTWTRTWAARARERIAERYQLGVEDRLSAALQARHGSGCPGGARPPGTPGARIQRFLRAPSPYLAEISVPPPYPIGPLVNPVLGWEVEGREPPGNAKL